MLYYNYVNMPAKINHDPNNSWSCNIDCDNYQSLIIMVQTVSKIIITSKILSSKV